MNPILCSSVYSVCSKNKYLLLLPVFVLGFTVQSFSQKERKRPPKQENVQTPKDAVDKKAEREAKFQEEYKLKKDAHLNAQDASTQKRMKDAMKKAKKLNKRGTTEPFYRRWFRKKKF